MRNKSFHDFLSNRETYSELAKPVANAADTGDEMQAPAASTPCEKTGMTKDDVPGFTRSLRMMLSTRGVVRDADQKAAARKILQTFRAPVQRLVNMGLSADDITMVVQEIINLVIGQKNFTGFSSPRVKTAVQGAAGEPQNMG